MAPVNFQVRETSRDMSSQHFSITASSGTMLNIYHGTDVVSAESIVTSGVNAKQAVIYQGEGVFWATLDEEHAKWIAMAMAELRSAEPAIVHFGMSAGVIEHMRTAPQPLVYETDNPHAYEFRPEGFKLLNASMTHKVVIEVQVQA